MGGRGGKYEQARGGKDRQEGYTIQIFMPKTLISSIIQLPIHSTVTQPIKSLPLRRVTPCTLQV